MISSSLGNDRTPPTPHPFIIHLLLLRRPYDGMGGGLINLDVWTRFRLCWKTTFWHVGDFGNVGNLLDVCNRYLGRSRTLNVDLVHSPSFQWQGLKMINWNVDIVSPVISLRNGVTKHRGSSGAYYPAVPGSILDNPPPPCEMDFFAMGKTVQWNVNGTSKNLKTDKEKIMRSSGILSHILMR